MSQKNAFLDRVGNEWFRRNHGKFGPDKDHLLNRLKRLPFIAPKQILEIGCGNGWRLRELREHYGCTVRGIEPSVQAVYTGNREAGEVFIDRGTADDLPYPTDSADMVIYGYCLGYCDPQDYFKVVAEGDRVLVDGGYLVIVDSPYIDTTGENHPHILPFSDYGVTWFKHDWRQFWLAHPAYKLQSLYTAGGSPSIVILRKSFATAFRRGTAIFEDKNGIMRDGGITLSINDEYPKLNFEQS